MRQGHGNGSSSCVGDDTTAAKRWEPEKHVAEKCSHE
jgi:hypothetical protein